MIKKFRDLLLDDSIDLDIYDDYADDCCEAYVGNSKIVISDKCEELYGCVFDLDVEIVEEDSGYEYGIVLIVCGNYNNSWQEENGCERLHKKLKRFLRKAAGYCPCEEYKELFGID